MYIYMWIYIYVSIYISRREKGVASSKNEFLPTSFGHRPFSREFILN